jgi:hypothetical protein
MQPQKSKATKPDSWAALFAAEIQRNETVFPANARSLEQIIEMRKATGYHASRTMTKRFLAQEVKSGRVKVIWGVVLQNGKLVNAARYIITS